MDRTEATFTAADGTTIFYRCWLPPEPRAVVLLAHGLAEHSGRYDWFAGKLAAAGYATYAPDHPGHGKTGGKRAHVGAFTEFTDVLGQVLDIARSAHPDLPMVLIGHSMGGLIAASFLLDRQDEFVAAVLSGAAIESPQKPPAFVLAVVRLLSRLLPRMPVMRLDASGISRDPEVVRAYEDDPLVSDGFGTAGLVTALAGAARRVRQEAATIRLPIQILHGGDDRLTSVSGSRSLHDSVASTDRQLKIYDRLYHEILNEPEREAVASDILTWLKPRVFEGGAAGSEANDRATAVGP